MPRANNGFSDEIRIFIVQALACFDSPSVVAEAVKQEFGLIVTRQYAETHDPTKRAGKGLGKKMRAIFEETRKAFLEDTSQVAISHRAVRLRALNRMVEKAEGRGNIALAAQLLEQAAKEVGDSYSNRHKHELTGKNGKELNSAPVLVVAPGTTAGQMREMAAAFGAIGDGYDTDA